MAAINMTGRDHARTPVQWDDTENAGFTQGTPWIPVNPNYREINAKAQVRDPGSVFSFYKALIALRRDPGWRDVLRDGTYTPLLDDDEHLFGYARALNGKTLLFAGNFSGEEIRLPQKRLPGERRELLLSVYGEIRTEGEDIVFRPYESWAAVCL
jgi:oligo-1,6-glucosidase